MRYDPLSRASPDALSEAWDTYVQSLINDEANWMQTFMALKKTFMTYNIEGEKVRVHLQSVGEGVPCCVLREQECPMCYTDSIKAADSIWKCAVRAISERLARFVKQLDKRWARHAIRRGEDRERERAAQEDVMDGISLAQVEQGKTKQRIRDIESDVYLQGLDSHHFRLAVTTLIKDGEESRTLSMFGIFWSKTGSFTGTGYKPTGIPGRW
ncbi:hypothetical protein ON010_g2952 [Phytophthora cinnamomi]|nr:hypothetical protein ON010_g2952 [Phytophthora cinnamomi]